MFVHHNFIRGFLCFDLWMVLDNPSAATAGKCPNQLGCYPRAKSRLPHRSTWAWEGKCTDNGIHTVIIRCVVKSVVERVSARSYVNVMYLNTVAAVTDLKSTTI